MGGGTLTLRAECTVTRVIIEDRGSGLEATGVEYADAAGQAHTVNAGVSRWPPARWAPRILIRSGVREASGSSPSSQLIGHHLGFHAARLVAGLFDEIQDAHMVYPITSHCLKFQTR